MMTLKWLLTFVSSRAETCSATTKESGGEGSSTQLPLSTRWDLLRPLLWKMVLTLLRDLTSHNAFVHNAFVPVHLSIPIQFPFFCCWLERWNVAFQLCIQYWFYCVCQILASFCRNSPYMNFFVFWCDWRSSRVLITSKKIHTLHLSLFLLQPY